VPVRQASARKKPAHRQSYRRTNRAFEIVAKFAIEPGALTLQQAQEAAAGCLARLLVDYFREHGQGFSQPVAVEGGE